jgi:hypothetical protein
MRYFAALLLVGMLCLPFTAVGEPLLTLPDDYADFVVHPETGNLAAVNPQTNQLVVFSRASLDEGAPEPIAEVKVGLTPVSVCYKQYKDKQVYAVVCSQQSKAYIIDATTNKLLEQIDTSASGGSAASSSINPDDPFIYINYGSGHDSEAGAISLRDMSYHASVVDDSMDLAVSADGTIIYRRGPWSPSGFESVILTNSLEDDKPTFARLYREHRSTPAYVADPHGQYAATGPKLFSVGLDRPVAELPFTPTTFLQTRPVIMGLDVGDTRRKAPQKAVIRSASYNSFEKVGKEVSITLPDLSKDAALPRGVNSQADFKRITRQAKLLPDEARDRVIFAYRKHVQVIPFKDLDLPDEPLVVATLKGDTTFLAGQPGKLVIEPSDKRIKIQVTDKPKGMTATGNALTWTPTAEDIGPVNVLVNLKHGTLEKSKVFTIDVAYPALNLPFDAAGIDVDLNNNRAVIWEKLPRDSRGQVIAQAGQTNALAVIDLDDGKVLAERRLATPIQNASLSGDNVLIWAPNAAAKIEVLKSKDLSRKATLLTQASLQSVETFGGYILAKSQQTIEVYEQDKLSKVKQFTNNQHHRSSRNQAAPEHALIVHGVVYNENLEPQWISQMQSLLHLTPTTGQNATNASRTGSSSQNFMDQFRRQRLPQGMQRLVYLPVPGRDAIASIEQRTITNQIQGATHTWHTTDELFVSYNAPNGSAQQALSRSLEYNRQSNRRSHDKPSLVALEDRAMVLDHDKLYQWDYPASDAAATKQPLALAEKQSALVIDNTKKTTVLKHGVAGGKAPLSYLLHTAYPGVEIDRKTGQVTVNHDELLAYASEHFAERHARNNRNYLQNITTSSKPQWDKACATLLGDATQGYPMGMPIQVEVSDQDLQTDVLLYYLVVDVPQDKVLEVIEAKEAEQAEARKEADERMAELREQRGGLLDRAEDAAEGLAEGGNQEAQLLRRIDKLERRVDLLTRQIELLLLELQNRPQRDDARDTPRTVPEIEEVGE